MCHCIWEANHVADALAKWSTEKDDLSTSSFNKLPVAAKGLYRLDFVQIISFKHKQQKNACW